jgi:hypothetical protein
MHYSQLNSGSDDFKPSDIIDEDVVEQQQHVEDSEDSSDVLGNFRKHHIAINNNLQIISQLRGSQDNQYNLINSSSNKK